MRLSLIILVLIAQNLFTIAPLVADEINGELGVQSEGTLSIGLSVLPLVESGIAVGGEAMEIGTHRLPSVIAQSLLDDSSITIGVCLPHTYSEGFNVASFSNDGIVPHVRDLAGNALGYRISQSAAWTSQTTYVAVQDSGCVRSGSSQVTINLNPLGRLQPKIILGKFNLLVQPE